MEESVEEPLTLSIDDPFGGESIEEPLTLSTNSVAEPLSVDEPFTLPIDEQLTFSIVEELDSSSFESVSRNNHEVLGHISSPLATSTPSKKRSHAEVDDESSVEEIEQTQEKKLFASQEVHEELEQNLTIPARPGLSSEFETRSSTNGTTTEGTSTGEINSSEGNSKNKLETLTRRTFFLLNFNVNIKKAITKAGWKTAFFYDVNNVTDVVVTNKRTNELSGSSKTVVNSALKHGLNVISVDELKYLLRQTKMQQKKISNTKVHVRKLSPPFIKVEDQSRKFKPIVKEFTNWPSTISRDKQDLSRNEPANMKKRKLLFCEHCQESNIINLQHHLDSKKHKTIISQKGYWERVDKLIKNGGTSQTTQGKTEIFAGQMYKVRKENCCTQSCLQKMDLIEMCIVRNNLVGRNCLQLRQFILDYMWEHARPNENNLEEMTYFLGGFKLCQVAFKKVIGITDYSFDSTVRDFNNGIRQLQKKKTRKLTERRLLAENWMEHYFKMVGDKMPNAGTIHLPSYLDKMIIYKTMSQEMKDKGQQPVHYSVFCKLFSTVFPHIKFPKVNRFTRCDYCTALSTEKRGARDKEVIAYLDRLFTFHNNIQMNERKVQYYKHREKARAQPDKYICIVQDGMDQAKLLLPRLTVIAHAYANARQLKTHLTGMLNHGRQPKGYFDLFQYPHDSNLTINILLLELQSMDFIPDTLYLQVDNCWRENKNQFLLNFLAVLVKLDIFKKVKVNFLMVGHTHEDIDQLFNRVAEYIAKREIRSISELMDALEHCYTPVPKSIMLRKIFDMKAWMEPITVPIHNVSNPHVFKITKSSDGVVYLKYKNWGSDKTEKWKPEGDCEGLKLLKDDVTITAERVPDLVVPNKEKVDLETLRRDITKFFSGSRVFSSEIQDDWVRLLDDGNALWNPQEKPASWPLQNLVLLKQNQIRQDEEVNASGFLGVRPDGVPKDLDDMVKDQVAPIREVYTGPYRRIEQDDVPEVDDFSQVAIGDLVAVNLEGYRPPNLATVVEILDDSFRVQWLKGGYNKKWSPWPRWPINNIPKESVIYFGFTLENDKLTKESAKYLRKRYKKV